MVQNSFRNEKTGKLDGGFVPVDFAMNAASYGCKTYKATTVEELKAALEDAEKQTVSTLMISKYYQKKKKKKKKKNNASWLWSLVACRSASSF